MQALGSAITYLRRYAIQALNIAAEEDDYGNAAAGNRAEHAPRPPRTAPAPQPAAEAPNALSDEDWAGLVEQPALLDSRPGLSSRDFFDRVDGLGIDRRLVGATAKKMYGADKWKVTELSDSERAGRMS